MSVPPSRLTLLGLLFTGMLHGDVVKTSDGETIRSPIQELTAEEVVTAEARLPLANTVLLTFESAELPAGQTGVVLKNGTRLAGSLLERNKEQIVFYSVTAGRLNIPMTEVAGLFYEPEAPFRDRKPVIPGLITRTGEVVPARRILWADMQSAALLTENGLQKFPTERVSRIWWQPSAPEGFLHLRNGDILNVPVRFEGTLLRFTLLGTDYPLPLEALRSIDFTQKPEETPGTL